MAKRTRQDWANSPENLDRLAAWSRSAEGRARSASNNKRYILKHGLASHNENRHPLWSIWANMMTRCYNQKYKQFKDYGGRGITVCERWHDPQSFVEDIERDIGPRTPGMTLDRVDNDGNYESGNVQWLSRLEQNRKKRSYRNGRTSHPLYLVWWNMTRRHPGEVHPQWLDFEIFAEDIGRLLGPRPDGYRFLRADKAELYEPGNVAWVTPAEHVSRAQAQRW